MRQLRVTNLVFHEDPNSGRRNNEDLATLSDDMLDISSEPTDEPEQTGFDRVTPSPEQSLDAHYANEGIQSLRQHIEDVVG